MEKQDPEEKLESRKFGRKLEEASLNCHPGNVFSILLEVSIKQSP